MKVCVLISCDSEIRMIDLHTFPSKVCTPFTVPVARSRNRSSFGTPQPEFVFKPRFGRLMLQDYPNIASNSVAFRYSGGLRYIDWRMRREDRCNRVIMVKSDTVCENTTSLGVEYFGATNKQ